MQTKIAVKRLTETPCKPNRTDITRLRSPLAQSGVGRRFLGVSPFHILTSAGYEKITPYA